MSKLIKVRVEVIEQDEDGTEHWSDLSAPTIDTAIEKLGAYEKHQERNQDKEDALFEGEVEQSKLEGENRIEK